MNKKILYAYRDIVDYLLQRGHTGLLLPFLLLSLQTLQAKAPQTTMETMTEAIGETTTEDDPTAVAHRHRIWNTVATTTELPHLFRAQQPNTITHAEWLYPVFDTLCYSGRPLRIVQIGDSHIAAKTLPLTLKQQLGDAWGMAENDSLGTGMTFSYMAKNGATAKGFLTPQRLENLQQLRPDLIIVSFGTNECHGWGYQESNHKKELEQTLAALKQYCPAATLLWTTPPGDYLTKRSVTYRRNAKTGKKVRRVRRERTVNPMTTRCANLLSSFATSHQYPIWNLNAITGGDYAARNWSLQRFMRPDKVHFTPQGYELQAKLLATALLTAYNSYIIQQP